MAAASVFGELDIGIIGGPPAGAGSASSTLFPEAVAA